MLAEKSAKLFADAFALVNPAHTPLMSLAR
jgi:hypothetical protein